MSKKEKVPKRKPKYGFFSCLSYVLKFIWQRDKSIVLSSILSIPVSLILSAIGLYLPSAVLNEVQSADSFTRVAAVIAGFIGAQLLFRLIEIYLDSRRNDSETTLMWEMSYALHKHEAEMDYHLHFKPEIIEIGSRAWNACSYSNSSGVNYIHYFCRITRNVLNFILFGSVVVSVHPVFLILLILGCLINWLMSKWVWKRNYRLQDEANRVGRHANYLAWQAANNFGLNKDIRLFGLSGLFEFYIQKSLKDWYAYYKKQSFGTFVADLVSLLVVFIRDGAAYAILIAKTIAGEISPAEFLLCFNAIAGLYGFINGILGTLSNMFSAAFSISDYREAFDIKNELNHGKGIPLPNGRPLSIEFRDVSFTYPKQEKPVLSHVSFRINAGEKIALVGYNGAGKTTLTHLMCGLLVPDEGEVLIDGHSVFEYNCEELYSLFSLVPQTFELLPLSIAENIAIESPDTKEGINHEKLTDCIRLAGLEKKLESLPKGADTLLNKQLNKDAAELSGGETQKLLFARALYRHAPILILDEPTAALDPIAENSMYQRYNEIQDTTSVFISHRLASTRFCDRILFMDNAVIAESGSHEELMDLGGKYMELFETQAKYYKEETTKEGDNQ